MHKHFSRRDIRNGLHFNYGNLIAVLELYKSEFVNLGGGNKVNPYINFDFFWNKPKCDLVWQQIFATLQCLFAACERQATASNIDEVNKNKNALIRSFKYKDSEGSFPVTANQKPGTGLGYEHAAELEQQSQSGPILFTMISPRFLRAPKLYLKRWKLHLNTKQASFLMQIIDAQLAFGRYKSPSLASNEIPSSDVSSVKLQSFFAHTLTPRINPKHDERISSAIDRIIQDSLQLMNTTQQQRMPSTLQPFHLFNRPVLNEAMISTLRAAPGLLTEHHLSHWPTNNLFTYTHARLLIHLIRETNPIHDPAEAINMIKGLTEEQAGNLLSRQHILDVD